MLRKRRTRQHIIADLAVHHVEGFVLRRGWTVERFWNDYGYDLNLYTYNDLGEIETESTLIQVKATDSLRLSTDGLAILFVLEARDLHLWLRERLPVILVVYDAINERAFWLSIQETFSDESMLEDRIYLTVPIPMEHVLSDATLTQLRKMKDDAFNRLFRRDT